MESKERDRVRPVGSAWSRKPAALALSLFVACVFLAGGMCLLDQFATERIEEYQPTFTAFENVVKPTCGGGRIICPNPNYVPRKPTAPRVGRQGLTGAEIGFDAPSPVIERRTILPLEDEGFELDFTGHRW